ncbi:hypothetical protein MMC26_006988 [Xylographa opegraphella]|nr:hypothetical protein [Xylographa opegraphella]
MYFSTAALVLATLAIDSAVAGPLRRSHEHFHAKKAAESTALEVNLEKRGSAAVDFGTLYEDQVTTLASLSVKGNVGVNAFAQDVPGSGGVWLGDDGDYVNEFSNASNEPVILVVWGPAGSWINNVQPLITLNISPGSSRNVSFATGTSGAFSAIYSDTTLVNGQVYNTWGEYTHSLYGVVDVSMEVNMSGHPMSIHNGNECVTDMEQCVFQCVSGNSCWLEYVLQNCASQKGAQDGTDSFGKPSGGCGDLGTRAQGQILRTTLS